MTEKMILEEFGRCLLQIIHTANGTKGESCKTFSCVCVSTLVCVSFLLAYLHVFSEL